MEAGRPVVLGPPGYSAGKPVVLGPPGSGISGAAQKPSSANPPSKSTPEPSTAPRSSAPSASKKSSSAETLGADKSAANASKASAVPTASPASAKPANPTPVPAPAKDVPKDAGSQNSGSKEASVVMPLAEGTYVRIFGLTGAAHLNGQLGQVLRLGDTPDRTVVRTGVGEKALKHANLGTGSVVYPRHTFIVGGSLFILTLLAVGDVCRTGGRNSLSAGAIPILAAIWVFVTLWLCMMMWWPCRPQSSWFPSVSDLGANAPVCNIYRTGFVVFALLFALTNGLYQEILLKGVDIPAPLDADGLFAQWQLDLAARAAAAEAAALAALQAPAPGPLLMNTWMAENGTEDAATTPNGTDDTTIVADAETDSDSSTDTSSSSWWSWLPFSSASKSSGIPKSSWMSWMPFANVETYKDKGAAEADPADSATETVSSSWWPSFWWPLNLLWSSSAAPAAARATVDTFNITAANATGPRRNSTNEMLITGPDRSLEWGYAAAGGIGIQAVFSFDGKVNWRGVVHSLGMLFFAFCVLQHSMQSNFWITLPWDKSLVGAPGWLGTALRLRRTILEYGPLTIMMGLTMGPLTASQMTNAPRNRHASNSMRSILKESGMPKSIALMLWALVLLVAVFYSTFAFDFWYAAENPRGGTSLQE